jgi:AmiR/NasT family two-component response regulator
MENDQTIVALASLFFSSKLKGLCEQAGFTYKGAIGPSGLIERIKEHNPVAILLDLGKDDIEIQKIVLSIKEQTSSPIIAFCGHVATEQLEEARACGCDVVTTNGAITGSFESVIQKALTN